MKHEPIRPKWLPNQNSRPINKSQAGPTTIYRVPTTGFLSPGLQRDRNTTAIGFTASLCRDEDF